MVRSLSAEATANRGPRSWNEKSGVFGWSENEKKVHQILFIIIVLLYLSKIMTKTISQKENQYQKLSLLYLEYYLWDCVQKRTMTKPYVSNDHLTLASESLYLRI